MNRCFASLFVCCATILFAPLTASAANICGGALAAICLMANPESQAKRIFDVAEAETPAGSSRDAIQSKLIKLAPAKADDYRVHYAYALALAHENRYSEALSATESIVKSKPKYLPARQTRAWLLLTLKRYSDSLKELEAVAMLLPAKELAATTGRATTAGKNKSSGRSKAAATTHKARSPAKPKKR